MINIPFMYLPLPLSESCNLVLIILQSLNGQPLNTSPVSQSHQNIYFLYNLYQIHLTPSKSCKYKSFYLDSSSIKHYSDIVIVSYSLISLLNLYIVTIIYFHLLTIQTPGLYSSRYSYRINKVPI